MNYPTIALLEERLSKNFNIFEYGSGFSTLFFSQLAGTVTAVENDLNWFEIIKNRAPVNAKIIFADLDKADDYVKSIHLEGIRYDVVIVDGRQRVESFSEAMLAIGETGVIVLDDSQRERYSVAFDLANTEGFRFLNLSGLKPTGISTDQSTVFYKSNNCLGL